MAKILTLLSRLHARTLIECIAIVCLMNILATVTWQLVLNQSDISQPLLVDTGKQDVGSINPRKEHSYLKQYDFFGPELTEDSADSKLDVDDIPSSSLPLKLTGVLRGASNDTSFALIAYKGKESAYPLNQVFKVGAKSIKILSIHPEKVVINVSGRQEALLLYPDRKNTPSKQLVKKHLTEAKQPPSLLPQKISEVISLTPVRNDGHLTGYRVYPTRFTELFYKSGLKHSDFVTIANGLDMSDSTQSVEIINNLESLQRIDLTVEREGMLYQVELSLL